MENYYWGLLYFHCMHSLFQILDMRAANNSITIKKKKTTNKSILLKTSLYSSQLKKLSQFAC